MFTECTNIGLNPDKVYWMRSATGREFWCRQAVGIFGGFNMSEEQRKRISPFDRRFFDNYVEGKGKTKKEALANMKKQLEDMSNALWSI